MKKVALELQPCCGKRSGIGVYTYELARRLKNRDSLEFCGNLFNFGGRNDNSESLNGITMPIRESRLFPYGVYRRSWNFLPLSYESLFPEKTDLTLFFNYIVPPKVPGKVMTVIHDLTYLRYPETMEKRNLRRIHKGIGYSVRRSDHVLTISQFSKREMAVRLGIPEEKISVVYPAPSVSEARADFKECSRKWSLARPYLLYVGTIEPRKNLSRLLRAFDLLKNREGIPHQLVLAGGRGWQDEEIMQTAKAITNARSVIFTGYLSDGEKNTLYQNADVFVFPSLYEGFGIPPLEAMSFGCPVVCSNAASLPEVVGETARLIDPLDERDIAQGIWDVLSNKEYASRLVTAGYRQSKKYTWDESAEKLTGICASVLEGP